MGLLNSVTWLTQWGMQMRPPLCHVGRAMGVVWGIDFASWDSLQHTTTNSVTMLAQSTVFSLHQHLTVHHNFKFTALPSCLIKLRNNQVNSFACRFHLHDLNMKLFTIINFLFPTIWLTIHLSSMIHVWYVLHWFL